MPSIETVEITGFSSTERHEAIWLRGVVKIIELQLGVGNFIEGSFVEDSGEKRAGRPLNQLSDAEISRRLVKGGFSFVSSDDNSLAGFVSNDRFAVSTIRVPQCEIGLLLPLRFRDAPELAHKVRSLCVALGRHAECNLLFCADRKNFDSRFDTALHLGIGLLDIYWINVYGPAYTRLIGGQRIAAAPALVAECSKDGYGVIQVTDTLQESIATAGVATRHALKEFLGMRFFAKPRNVRKPHVGQLSVWKFWKVVGIFRAHHSSFSDISRKAEVVPDFCVE